MYGRFNITTWYSSLQAVKLLTVCQSHQSNDVYKRLGSKYVPDSDPQFELLLSQRLFRVPGANWNIHYTMQGLNK